MEVHPIAELFPLMTGDEFESLKKDINENGLREPIVIHENKIVDGRNRFLACEAVGKKPVTVEWDKRGSLVAFVVSLNLHRRHLTSGQKAMIAAELLPHLEAEAKERQIAAGSRGHEGGRGNSKETLTEKVPGGFTPTANHPAKPNISPDRAAYGEARQQAAKLVGVNPHYITDAKRLKKENPELAKQVASGSVGIKSARDKHREEGRPQGKVRFKAKPGRQHQSNGTYRPVAEIIDQLYSLTESPSLVAPYSEIRRLVTELRDTFRKQQSRLSKGA